MKGPLVVSSNPRYFEVDAADPSDRRLVYLTGSHVNNNFHDGAGPGRDCAETPERFDFEAYLEFLADHGHNFVRLWRWENFRSQIYGADVHLCMSPQPWPRTAAGTALDGKPKFDLARFDPVYFDRLRDRVEAAQRRGIYVSVMLFEGFALHLTATPDNVEGHPFHPANNVNDVGIESIRDYHVLPLSPRIREIQEAYIRKVVDTVHDLPNVLYEVANESSGDTAESIDLPDGTALVTPIGDSTQWQYWVIDFLKSYETKRGYDAHPVGMTMQYPVPDQAEVNVPLFESAADWISPGFDEETPDGTLPDSRWRDDPPPNDGAKVILSDTDHYSPMGSHALWAWKTFLRGHHPVLYDLGIFGGARPADPSAGAPSYESLEPARLAMGDTLRCAERVRLREMAPRGELVSTGYALVNPGVEYLVLQPDEDADHVEIELPAGTYRVHWFGLVHRDSHPGTALGIGADGRHSIRQPREMAGPAVLYLCGDDGHATAGPFTNSARADDARNAQPPDAVLPSGVA